MRTLFCIEFYHKDRKQVDTLLGPAANNQPQVREGIEKVLAKIAEREALVKLMSEVELILERKDAILTTMEKCNCIHHQASENDEDNNIIKPCQTREHHMWLQSNLKVTNRALDIALAQLQIIYGKGYTGYNIASPTLEKKRDIANKEVQLNLTTKDPNKYHSHYLETMDNLAFDIGRDIATKAAATHYCTEMNEYTCGMLASAGGLLTISDVLADACRSDKKRKSALDTKAILEVLEQLKPEPIHLRTEVAHLLRSRELAYTKLTDAARMLLSELIANNQSTTSHSNNH